MVYCGLFPEKQMTIENNITFIIVYYVYIHIHVL